MAIRNGSLEGIQACIASNSDADDVVDVAERSAQALGGGVSVNITELGAKMHGIKPQDDVRVVVHEEGIWMEPIQQGQQGR